MSKPNFLLIGAQKSATTSISVMLSNHPDVFVVKGKESHFFSENRRYARGWNWYMSLFSGYIIYTQGSFEVLSHLTIPKGLPGAAQAL